MNGSSLKSPAPMAALVLAWTLAGCGAGPGPDLLGPQGQAYLTAYSGDWVLLPLESDDLDAEFREAMAGRPGASAGGKPGAGVRGGRGGGMTGGRPGGGMTGSRPGSGRRPGGGIPGTGGGLDPEEMRRAMQATMVIARTPTELAVDLSPREALLTRAGGSPARLPLGGDEVSVNQEGVEYFEKAEWTSEGLIIERKVDRGGSVKDKMKVDDQGRLIVEREIDALRGGKVQGTLVYRKNER